MVDKETDGAAPAPSVNAVGCTNFYVDSIKAMAESIGVSNLQDEAAKELAEDITYRLKVVIQDAAKFMELGKRKRLTTNDVELSMKVKNMEPLYGIQSYEVVPFRFASGGGRELHFVEEKEQDLHDLMSASLPQVPVGTCVRTHWLAIEGQQPAVPENPPPLAKDLQRTDNVDQSNKMNKGVRVKGPGTITPIVGKPIRFITQEQVFIKQLATHELSVEQQLYYKEITEACVGSDGDRRTEALQSLANDPGLYEMLPKLCAFISESVRVNVVQCNLALLIYLMRMVNGLLENPTLYLQKYLHEIIPSVATCIVSKQLCLRPDKDNHWALRDFAAKLMGQICKTYNTPTNNIRPRITKVFSQAITQEKMFLSSMYGAIAGLGELGPEVIKTCIIPNTKDIVTRLEHYIEDARYTQADKASAGMVKKLLLKILPPVVKSLKCPPDNLEEYKVEFGQYLGQSLHGAVVQLRSQELKSVQVAAPVVSKTIAGTPVTSTQVFQTKIQGSLRYPVAGSVHSNANEFKLGYNNLHSTISLSSPNGQPPVHGNS